LSKNVCPHPPQLREINYKPLIMNRNAFNGRKTEQYSTEKIYLSET
jgi:hypothetical protein